MHTTTTTVQDFANCSLVTAQPGFLVDTSAPAMATPVAGQFVVQGSTICWV